MTPQERQQVRSLIRMREQRAKNQVDAFAAERMAQFEQDLATIYQAHDERWKHISELVHQVESEANAELKRICEAEGIAESFRPHYSVSFYRRGENVEASRRAELRKVAQTRVKADAKAAKISIENASAEIQEELLIGGLHSEEAKRLVERMPDPQALMPPLPTVEIVQIEEASGHKGWERRALPPLLKPGG
jgi:hypothetical protein